MVAERPFDELNLWQRIFADHWDAFESDFARSQGCAPPEHWRENVERMLSCGDIREGYYEYGCEACGATRKVGFTCKSRLCLRCFKTAVDDWLEQAGSVLFEGVVHRQVVLTVPKVLRPLIVSDAKFLKAFMDAGAAAVKTLIEQWRPKQRIRVGIMAVLQLHGRSGNQNPHLHFVVSEGGVDAKGHWRAVNYFDTRKLRKQWQYQVLMALKKAVRGTCYQSEWTSRLGSMFRKYPTGFDCDCTCLRAPCLRRVPWRGRQGTHRQMPEKGPVERLIVYLCKYVSSPPISLRRITHYDGNRVTYRYDDHRRGKVCETISAVEFIARMIRHLPPKGFRMVRYYGIYARPIRKKIHTLVCDVLQRLVQRAEAVAQYFARRNAQGSGCETRDEAVGVGKAPIRCANCGSTNMILLRIWDKHKGIVYEAIRDGPSSAGRAARFKPPRPLVFAGDLPEMAAAIGG